MTTVQAEIAILLRGPNTTNKETMRPIEISLQIDDILKIKI